MLPIALTRLSKFPGTLSSLSVLGCAQADGTGNPRSTWVVDNACKGSASSRGLTSVTLAGVGHGVVIRGAVMALVSPDQGIDSK